MDHRDFFALAECPEKFFLLSISKKKKKVSGEQEEMWYVSVS